MPTCEPPMTDQQDTFEQCLGVCVDMNNKFHKQARIINFITSKENNS